MEVGAITGYIDAAQVVLYVFWAFFFLLILHLHQEGKREGYPLQNDLTERNPRASVQGFPAVPSPKTFRMSDGTVIQAPDPATADTREHAIRPVAKHPGAAFEPTGNPMVDGVGPASYAERKDIPDAAIDGSPKLKPMRAAGDGWHIAEEDPDIRGWEAVGADGETGGTVADVWVDTGEFIIRYLELDVPGAGHRLLPMTMSVVDAKAKKIRVNSILGSQFVQVPATANPDVVTRLEEDKICGYYGGGTLYATKQRAEPMV
jgi:photosynthetic reaction center H subunit